MAITQLQLKARLKSAMDAEADQEVSPAEARDRIATEMAAAVNDFVVGRLTTVTGTSVSGGAVTATGTIN